MVKIVTKEEKTYLGHRTRVRSLIEEIGVESLPPYQVLEYILFHAIPRKDTKSIAYELLDKFGSFYNVLLADVSELVTVKDMTRNAALLLHSLPGIFSVYHKSKLAPKTVLGANAVLPYLQSLFVNDLDECLYALYFNAKKQLLHVDKINDGSATSVQVPFKKVTALAIRYDAKSVLITHNHPSDNPLPSAADREATATVLKLLSSMAVPLIDHVIIGSEYAYSFAMQSRLTIKDSSYPINNLIIT